MTARILNGRELAGRIERELAAEVAAFHAALGRVPRLAVVLVGEMAASASYVKSKHAAATRVGIDAEVRRVPATTSTNELVDMLGRLVAGESGAIDGILVQLPLPDHVDARVVLDAVPPAFDVDGFHPENAGLLSQGRPRFVPCTAAGVQRMLLDAGIPTAGRHAVIVGRSDIVGKPLALLLAGRTAGGDATVTLCHSRSQGLAAITREADILVAAAGVPGLITADMVKAGATVIDVGINRIEKDGAGKLVGDVDFGPVSHVAGAISPVPGGVGPLTVAMLLANTLLAAELGMGRPHGRSFRA
jgi:methylenetetrahydrofolate dehydrogenase (NADP+)/methenyltetrahydrofolate cyclohydrolase